MKRRSEYSSQNMNDTIIIPELEEAMRNYQPHYRPWTLEEEAIMRKYFGKVQPKVLAGHLHRSKYSIDSKAAIMGLTGRKE